MDAPETTQLEAEVLHNMPSTPSTHVHDELVKTSESDEKHDGHEEGGASNDNAPYVVRRWCLMSHVGPYGGPG